MAVNADFKVWEGVYRSFGEAPVEGPGFDGAEWRTRSLAAAKDGVARLGSGEPLDYSLRQRNAVLPPLVATLLAAHPRVSVLDFGGGLGFSYLALAQAVRATAERVDYEIVEVASICKAGTELFDGKGGPAFREDLPRNVRVDIVHAASVMQYIEDWRGMIGVLAAGRPAFLSFADIFAGNFQPYVSLQNYYGSRIPHWFLNLDAFIAAVESHGYRLSLRTPCHVQVLGRHGPLPMENLPAALRIANTHHLLFARVGDRA